MRSIAIGMFSFDTGHSKGQVTVRDISYEDIGTDEERANTTAILSHQTGSHIWAFDRHTYFLP